MDRYISINQFKVTELLHRTHVSRRKISVVHDGTEILGEPFSDPCPSRDAVLMLANFVPFKGHDILVEGINLLRETGIPLHAYLYGTCPGSGTKGEDRTELELIQGRVKELDLEDLIHFCGHTRDIYGAMADKWALVLPSYSEGTPNCVLEAMSLKRLVICSNVGGVPELIEEGVTGYVHIPASADAFARAVEKARTASDAVNKEIVERAYCVWEKSFSDEQLVAGLMGHYALLNSMTL